MKMEMENNHALSILYVEDEPAHAFLTITYFSRSRIPNRITHVSDGQDALDYIFLRGRYTNPDDAPKPDIILLDLRLPKIDGLKVLQEIKTDENVGLIPVAILTTSDAEADRLQAYKYHVNSYLVKPSEPEKFSAMIDTFGSYWYEWNKNAVQNP
jgi:CheY-like chemotaxis protein